MSTADLKSGLYNLMRQADVEDIDVLVDYLTDKGEGRLMLDSDVCRQMIVAKKARVYERSLRETIAEQIRAFGGNTLVNLFRKEPIDYSVVVRDVADHLKVSRPDSGPDVAIEVAIIQKLFLDSVAKMPAEERQKMFADLGISDPSNLGGAALTTLIAAGRLSGFAIYKMTLVVANAIAKAILGRGLSLAANTTITRALGVMLGPVGWVLTGLWTAVDLASPAYRVTVPCVIQIAYMRQKALTAFTHVTCPNPDCGTMNPREAKFCPECGTRTPAAAEASVGVNAPAA